MSDRVAPQIEELQALIALAEHGSFAAAGRALRRHPTVVTKRVAALELRLAVRLAERTTRQVRLTEAGARLVEEAQQALAMLSDAQARASISARELLGQLRVAMPGTFGRVWLAPKLPDFLSRHPRLRLELELSEHFADLVSDRFDAAVRIGTLPDSSLVARRLAGHRRILCASPAYIEREGTPATPAELERHSCLEFSELATFPYWHLTSGSRVHKVVASGRLQSNDAVALREAARAGLGVLGAGEWLTASDIREGRLVRVLPEWSLDQEGGIYLVRPSSRFETAAFSAFADWMGELFSRGTP